MNDLKPSVAGGQSWLSTQREDYTLSCDQCQVSLCGHVVERTGECNICPKSVLTINKVFINVSVKTYSAVLVGTQLALLDKCDDKICLEYKNIILTGCIIHSIASNCKKNTCKGFNKILVRRQRIVCQADKINFQ